MTSINLYRLCLFCHLINNNLVEVNGITGLNVFLIVRIQNTLNYSLANNLEIINIDYPEAIKCCLKISCNIYLLNTFIKCFLKIHSYHTFHEKTKISI